MNLARLGVRNPIFANLVMWALVLGGIFYWFNLVREMFPNFEPEQVIITVPYPGATPDEIEKSVTLRIERQVKDVDGIDEVSAEVLEGATALRLTLDQGADRAQVLSDLRAEMDVITPDLPDGAEDPVINELRPFFPVIGVVVYGDVSEERLRGVAIDLRDELLELDQITTVRVIGQRDREILAEIHPARLEEFGLTFGEVGRVVAQSNLDLPGGQMEGPDGTVRVRTLGEDDSALELENLVVRTNPDGSAIRLSHLAEVREGFEDKVEIGRFQGKRAVQLSIFKTPEQDAIDIAQKVKAFVAEGDTRLDGAVQVATLNDLSRFVEQRIDLMVRNARMGIILVILALGLFLNLRVSFWVTMGLAVSFLGTFVAMDFLGLSINLITLFALIVVLGLIVDDAIVIGENVFMRMRQGESAAQAAIVGTTEMMRPVLAAVLTTMIAFAPLAFIEGRLGKWLGAMPIVVVCALGMSLIEAFLILPAHLGHQKPPGTASHRLSGITAWWDRVQERKQLFFENTLPDLLERVLRFALRWRYASMAAAAGFSLAVFGLVAGGIVPFVLLQDTDAERVVIDLEMAAGTPEDRTIEVVAELEKLTEGYREVNRVFSVVGTLFSERGRESAADPATVGQINVELHEAEERQSWNGKRSDEIVNELRRKSAGIPGVHTLRVTAQGGGPQGADLEIRIRCEDDDMLERAVRHVRAVVGSFDAVSEIEDDLREGKLEARLRLRDTARSLGLTTRDLALQMRYALFGFEAQDLQEDDEEVTVRVVLPQAARTSLADLSRLRIATPEGARIPLSEVAEIVTERGYASLSRVDGKRAITLKAEVDATGGTTVAEVTADVTDKLADIGTLFPGVSITFEGRKKETADSMASLAIGFPTALLLIYAILAIIFRSYAQPLMVMAAIPYAIVGAILGHLIAGYPFTLLSMIGTVALSGIVVNDSLILVDYINRKRREGLGTEDAIVAGARARVRAILLTSITTILGLAPLMLETSFQAQFLIPMAVSIVYGLAFATALTLILLPTLYLALEDLRGATRWLLTGRWDRSLPVDLQAVETADRLAAESHG